MPIRNPSVSDEAIIAAYNQCPSAYKVARQLDVSSKRVYRVLGNAGIEPRGLQHYRAGAAAWPEEVQQEIARRYAEGESSTVLNQEYGFSLASIHQAIRRCGGTLRKAGTTTQPRIFVSEAQIATICDLYQSGLSQEKISYQIKVSQGAISRVLRRAKIDMRRDNRMRRLKTGRMKAGGGYVRVLVAEDDPFAVMRDRNGYILEHRIVMARALGRPLRDNETVHHINGDHADNRIANLQIRQGRHGKGVVMHCLDCGSHNIGPVEISE